MKRVGIITFHYAYNYGSVLQTYALQHKVEKMGYSVKIINYVFDYDFEQYKMFRTKLYKKQKKSFVADVVYFFPNFKRRSSFKKFARDTFYLTDKIYHHSEQLKELNKDFDIFICGSDQIWNFKCTNGIESAYFLRFAAQDKIKIAYAPSISHLQFEPELTLSLSEYINYLDLISIREKSTLNILKTVTDRRIEVVLDPTLLLDPEEYFNIMSSQKDFHYIFVYELEGNTSLETYAHILSSQTGLKIVYISKKKKKVYGAAKKLYGITPNDFLSYLYYADYVVTNSFHATVFSILFEKKFCTFKTAISFSRVMDLLSSLELEACIYQDDFDIQKKIDFGQAKQKLRVLREESEMYLKNGLKLCK